MSNKTFPQKEIEVLRTSPYVQNVSQSMVFFSARRFDFTLPIFIMLMRTFGLI